MAMREKMWLLPSHFASPDGDRVLYCITVVSYITILLQCYGQCH